jgi:hypothetical protein
VSAADLREAVEAAAVPPSADEARRGKMTQREYTFPFQWKDAANGKVFSGTFTSRVPDMRTRMNIGVMRARLCGGLDYAALDPVSADIATMVAYLTFALVEKDRPEWARDLLATQHPALLRALYAEVTEHEATFLAL